MSFPKMYHPDHPRNEHPEPAMRKTLTPSNQIEFEGLLRLGWKVVPDEVDKAVEGLEG